MHTEDAERRDERSWTMAARSMLALALVAACVRPMAYGASAGEVASTVAFLALHMLLPGWLAWRALRPGPDDALSQVTFGWTIGAAMQIAVCVALNCLHVEGALAYWPLVSLPLAWLARRNVVDARRLDPTESATSPRVVFGLALVLLVAVLRSRILPASGWWRDFDIDTLFHSGNAAALARGEPFEDPRVAGLAFNYHFFAYSAAAGLREVFGVPIGAGIERLLTSWCPVLLALQVFVTTRALARRASAGLVAAALVILHADLGFDFVRLVGATGHALDLRSYLEYAVYRSPSMALGLVFFAAMARFAAWMLADDPRARVRAAVAAGFVAAVAAGTKGTVMPVAMGASGLLVLLAWRRRIGLRAALLVFAAFALPAAPMTAWLALGGDSHAGAMFRVSPWHAVQSSGPFEVVAAWFGWTRWSAPLWLEWALALPWLVLLFGPAGLASVFWLLRSRRLEGRDAERGANAGAPAATATSSGDGARGRRVLRPIDAWLAGSAVVGMGLAFVLGAPGLSELFFLYPGQIAVVLLGAMWLTTPDVPRARRIALAVVLGAAPFAGFALDIAAQVRRDLRPKPVESALFADYRAGMGWIREHTPPDAVLIGGVPEMCLSAQSERCVFFETERFAARHFAANWERIEGRWRERLPAIPVLEEREALRAEFARAPTVELVRRAAGEIASERPVYAIVDRLTLSHRGEIGSHYEIEPVGDERLPESSAVELVFENEALRVYRWRATASR